MDPPAPEPSGDRAPILASDAERDGTVARLREAVGEGRLTLEEFAQRAGLAQTARTDAELAALETDLPAARPASGVAPVHDHRAVCSHLIREGPWELPAESSWRSYFGTIDLDLRQARLAGDEVRLQVYNLFGTVTVLVPQGVGVTVSGGGLFASEKIETGETPPIAGAPRLHIDLSGPGGTLYVRSRPPLKSVIKRALKG